MHPDHTGPSGLGAKVLVSVGLAAPLTFNETTSLIARVAIGALVAGVVNILLEYLRGRYRRWLVRPATTSATTPAPVPSPAVQPALTEISGELPGVHNPTERD